MSGFDMAVGERDFGGYAAVKSLDELELLLLDELETYRRYARVASQGSGDAIDPPNWDPARPDLSEGERELYRDLDPDLARAFAEVARYLASYESPVPTTPLFDDALLTTLEFLTGSGASLARPHVRDGNGHLLRFRRDGDQPRNVSVVAIAREDGAPLRAQDLRLPYGFAAEIDATIRARVSVDRQQKEALSGTELYRRVADLYVEAQNAGIPTGRHIAVALGYEENYVRQLVHRARKHGMLPRAEERKG